MMSEESQEYIGFCMDVLNKLTEMLNFNYEIHESYDGAYGVQDPDTLLWNGMVGELMDGVS